MRSATIYNFLIEANIMASIAIVLMLAVRTFLRGKIGSRVLWFAWLLVAVRLLCPLALPNPAMNEIVPVNESRQAVRPIANQILVRFIDTTSNVSDAAGRDSTIGKIALQVASETYNGRFARSLLWVYFAGAAGVLGYMVIQNARFHRKLKSNRVEELSGEPYEQYLMLCKQKGLRPIPVYLTDPLPSALMTGVFHPYIALPLSTPPEFVIKVLAHELCHVKGRDNLWGLVRNLCCIIHWFNPLVWCAAAMSRTDCELTCDDRVTDGFGQADRLAYANALVQASAPKGGQDMTVIATCMSMTGRLMKNRVSLILSNGTTLRWLSAGFAALASVTLLFAFATAEYIPPVFAGDPPQTIEGFADFTKIQSEGKALAYAKSFMSHELLGIDVKTLDFKISREFNIWTIEAYPPDGLAYSMTFDVYGMITGYNYGGTSLDYAQMKPSVSPITGTTPEGMEYLQLVTSFANAMLPGVGSAFDEIRIDSDVTNGDGRYLFLSTENGRTLNAHAFTLEIKPSVRLLTFIPSDESYLVFNVTSDRNALSAYTEDNAKKDLASYLTEVAGFSYEQVNAGTLSAEFSPDELKWVAQFTIAADQVTGELKNTLISDYGPMDSFTLERRFDSMGRRQ